MKLPRLGLYALCLVYIFAGLIGRDPWKAEDATGFGVMWTMAHGSLSDWLLPNVAGAPMIDDGPLMFWLGALAIKLFSPLLEAGHAARLANLVFFLLSARALWYATYLLGRRPAAQPLALAFGGQPEAHDYGHALADAALLILLGTAGLLTRTHESSSDAAMLAMLCTALYGMVRSLDRPGQGALWMALGLTGLGLTAGTVITASVALAWIGLLILHPDVRDARRFFLIRTLPLTLIGLSAWPLLAWWLAPGTEAYFAARLANRLVESSGTNRAALAGLLKTLPWFAWIAWPLALWGVWSWRRQARAAHIAIPAALLGAALLLLLSTPRPAEGDLLTLMPALIVLAAFGLPTLKRGAANGIDWFSLTIHSSAAMLIWLGWIALTTGYPSRIAANFARQTNGYIPGFDWIAFLLALAASLAWVLLVYWRLTRHPKVLWRSVVLSGAGLTLSWLLLMTLWMPAIDYSKTYRTVAHQLASRVPAGDCVQTESLGLAQRASFAYFAHLQFTPVAINGEQADCNWLLRQDHQRQLLNAAPAARPGSYWTLVWEGQRPSDRDERFRLYQRIASPASAAP
jgi:4-amino-4-deoxy-L-arabinose transferase-like glycosyltransferase